MQPHVNVCHSVPVTKDKFKRLLASSWGRIWPVMGKAAMAQAMGLENTKTIDRAVTGANLPEAHVIFNSLAADPTALDEILREYGFTLRPLQIDAANDILTAAGVIKAMGELVRALDDGRRDHNETLAIAQLLRPHLPAMQAIIAQADELRGVA